MRVVRWNAIILLARWGGLVRQRGIMGMAGFSNVVTSWSWFGVNMLGIGLHSYGFMDSAFPWLIGFGISQVCFMIVGALPPRFWRSQLERVSAPRTAPALAPANQSRPAGSTTVSPTSRRSLRSGSSASAATKRSIVPRPDPPLRTSVGLNDGRRFRPLGTPDTHARDAANVLRVVGQLQASVNNKNGLDLVRFLQGEPGATVERKTDSTQSIGDAIDQYRFDRLPRPKGQPPEQAPHSRRFS